MENFQRLPIPDRSNNQPQQQQTYINSTPQTPFPIRPLPTPNATAGPSNYVPNQMQSNGLKQSNGGRYPTSLSAEEVRRNSHTGAVERNVSGSSNSAMYRGVHMRDGSGGSITSPQNLPTRSVSPLPPNPRIQPQHQVHHQQQQQYSHPLPPQYQPQLSPHPSQLPRSHSPSIRTQISSSPLPPGTFCTATSDHESLSVVPLSNLPSVAAVKERILAKLHIGDDEYFSYSFYLTRIGASEGEGRKIDDFELWEACWLAGTEGKSLTIFVQQTDDNYSNRSPLIGNNSTMIEEDYGSSAASRFNERINSTGVPSPTSGASAAVANLRRSSNNRSPSNSSRSDISSHLGNVMLENTGEYSPVSGERRSSWLPHSNSGGIRGSGSGSPENVIGGLGLGLSNGGGNLSPPIDSRGRSSQGSLTPTAAEDYWADQQHQQQHHHPSQRRPSAPAAIMSYPNSSNQMPVRKLPGAPSISTPRNQSPHDEHRRNQTIPPATMLPPSASQGWSRPISSYQQQSIPPQHQQQLQQQQQQYQRPPPASDLRLNHGQYSPSSTSPEYHNLSLQGVPYQALQQNQPLQQGVTYTNYGRHSPTFQSQPSYSNNNLVNNQGQRIMGGSKSSDNLRGYPPSQQQQQQIPPIPGPVPPQYLRPNSNYLPNSRASPSIQHQQLPQPPSPLPNQIHQQPFDPRVMRPSPSPSTTSNPNSYSQPPPLHQRPLPPSSNQIPPPIRRPSQPQVDPRYDPRYQQQHQQQEIPYMPDISSIRPGEQSIRQQSDGMINNNTNIRPPVATLMRVNDPTLERKRTAGGTSPLIGSGGFVDEFELDRYGITSPSGSRRESSISVAHDIQSLSSSSGARKSSGESVRMKESTSNQSNQSSNNNLSPISGGNGNNRDRVSPRDSGSSFASSNSSTSRSHASRQQQAPGLISSIVPQVQIYNGQEDDRRNYQRSSTSSARSSTSAGGPLTPANDSIPNAVQDVVHSTLKLTNSTYSDEFDDPIEDDSTWFPINQPIKSPMSLLTPINTTTTTTSSNISAPSLLSNKVLLPSTKSLLSPGGMNLLEPSPEEAGSGTIRAHDWAESCLSSFPKDEEENTITNHNNLTPNFLPPLIIDTKLNPTIGEKLGAFVEDPAFYFPELSSEVPSISTSTTKSNSNNNKYPETNEFDDDEETSTYIPGFGPSNTPRASTASVSSPTSPSPVIGVSLRDEPSSRSPILDRHQKEKRPTLTLITGDASTSPPLPNTIRLPESSTSSSTPGIPSPIRRVTPTRRSAGSSSNEGISLGASLSSLLPNLTSTSTPSTTPSTSIHSNNSNQNSPPRRQERLRPSPGSTRLSELTLSQLSGGEEGRKSSPKMHRHNSFASREKDWAFRPPVETVLEHLEDFFPEHDLDKPIFDAPPTPVPGILDTPIITPPSSTTATSSSAVVPPTSISSETSSLASPKLEEVHKRVSGNGLKYKKSIRHVAQNQKKSLLKAGASNRVSTSSGHEHKGSHASAVMRRKSTKLFGNRLEEVTARQIKQMEEPILENSNLEDPENFSFKWIKGELIGRGTFGHVYLAYNITAAEFIAVKQVELPKTRSDQADLRQQGMVASLKAEIELLKDLEHPKIVEYLGMEETVEHLSIFLEYVPGGSVGRIVRTHGKFEENIIKSFTYQILEGLEYLHSLGILHRDLKADNILCDHQGRCKISDFGTSKRSNDIYNNNANMSMQGSIFWMAPEVINNFKQGQGYSAKADIWSLGCVCLEMFAGRRPWSDDEAIQAMFKLGSERIPPPIPTDVTLSKSASHFLSNCLSIDSEMRPRASQLMRHSFLALPDNWSFLQTTLYRAIAASGDELSFQ